jgi:hypothetical protein
MCVALLGGWVTAARADEVPPEQLVEFRRLVAQRNQLHQRLHALDQQAAETIKREEQPIRIHAEQIAIEDQLDLIQVRLEMLAMRYDLVIPPVPVLEESDQADDADARQGRASPGTEFARGRQRALEELKRQTVQLLKSINYEAFLQRTEPED